MEGQRIAHYEVQSCLGGGGMREVYAATDSRLDRTVAIKVHRLNSPPTPIAANASNARRRPLPG